jgi:hypothetical protein
MSGSLAMVSGQENGMPFFAAFKKDRNASAG